ncbi:hypothetical protein SS05631_b51540 (plasmid) [Sinorhizobium sp. CCBAU 05631]|nr:hypothetical protein SS05631_b51540 [Sinorhizobium sp. CCBAU 05631]
MISDDRSEPLSAKVAPQRISSQRRYGSTALFGIESLKHLHEPKVLCTKLISQQPLEPFVVCVKGGKLVERDRIVSSLGPRLQILVLTRRIACDRLSGGTLDVFTRGARWRRPSLQDGITFLNIRDSLGGQTVGLRPLRRFKPCTAGRWCRCSSNFDRVCGFSRRPIDRIRAQCFTRVRCSGCFMGSEQMWGFLLNFAGQSL